MTNEEVNALNSTQLRQACREACKRDGKATSWIAVADSAACREYLLHGGFPGEFPGERETQQPAVKNNATHVDAASNLASALDALVKSASSSVSEERVRAIVKETAIDREALTELVRSLVADSDIIPTVSFTLRDGASVKVEGVTHPITVRLAALMAAQTRTWIHGPAGTGKTTTARMLAEAAGLKVFVQGPCLTRYDVLGYLDSQSRVVDTPVSRFVRYDGPKCLIFDEVDGFGEGATLACNLMLANGHVDLSDGEHKLVRDGSPHWIVATANTVGKGATSTYVGRKRLDGAFLDRFDAFPLMGLHEPTERKIAKGIIAGCENASKEAKDAADDAIAISQKVRDAVKSLGLDLSWSPRKTFALVNLVLRGDTAKVALGDLLGATDRADEIIKGIGL